jgi:hypothetical protein
MVTSHMLPTIIRKQLPKYLKKAMHKFKIKNSVNFILSTTFNYVSNEYAVNGYDSTDLDTLLSQMNSNNTRIDSDTHYFILSMSGAYENDLS